jgi:Fur family ferric uptake transcriptional regulator
MSSSPSARDEVPSQEVAETLEAFHKKLQHGGLKSTRQRDLIVERFFTLNKHISAEELLDAVRQDQPRIGYATVYRTLKLLVEQGFAVTKDFGDGFMRYDPVHSDEDPHHDHLICIDCRRIIEFNDEQLAQRVEALAAERGFTLQRKKLELYVSCNTKDCPHREA